MTDKTRQGWPVLEPGTAAASLTDFRWVTGRVRAGDVATVLYALCRRYAAEVEPIVKAHSWGWHYRPVRGAAAVWSEHSAGTAIDLNAPAHPMGVRGTFTATQQAAIRRILADFGGVVVWGGDWRSRPDEMHFELRHDPEKIRALVTALQAGEGTQPKESSMTATRVAETHGWFETIRGKRIDEDNFPVGNEAQCVDVPKHHLRVVLGGTPGSFGNGKDVARGIVAAGYHVAVDPRTTTVQAGDVVSFGAPLGQVRRKDGTVANYGHVGIAYADQAGATVRVVDQDGYSSGQGVHVSEFPVSYIVGIARPKRYLQAAAPQQEPKEYVVTVRGLNRRTKPGDLRASALAYPDAPLYRGARWHGTGKTAKDARGGTWVEGRSDWEKSAGRKPSWAHGAYLKAIS